MTSDSTAVRSVQWREWLPKKTCGSGGVSPAGSGFSYKKKCCLLVVVGAALKYTVFKFPIWMTRTRARGKTQTQEHNHGGKKNLSNPVVSQVSIHSSLGYVSGPQKIRTQSPIVFPMTNRYRNRTPAENPNKVLEWFKRQQSYPEKNQMWFLNVGPNPQWNHSSKF